MKNYRDPKSTVISDWKWKPLRQVQKKFDISEIPSHVEAFGDFMNKTAQRAAEQGLTPRDLVKAYTLTRFSIQRTARKALILRKAGLILPSGVDDQDKVRPEGAFGHWLHTKLGQQYLDNAEAGRVDEEAIADAQQKLRTFGKVDKDLPDALRWAPKNLPGKEARVSELVRRSWRGESDPSEWRDEMRGLKGIRSAKAGFIAAQLGRGDQPTLDARQIVEHTGQPSKLASKYTNRSGGLGATEAVQRLAARQSAMDLSMPQEMRPHYQHLAHHAFWDKASNEVTPHTDVMDAMQNAKNGGRIGRADGGRNRLPTAVDIIRAMRFAGFPAMEEAHRLAISNPEAFKNLVEGVYSRYSDNPENRKRAEEIADSYKIPLTGRLMSDSAYYNIKQPVTPQRVKSTVEPLPGAPLKPKRFMSWEDLHREGAGGTLINLGGDRSRSGILTHIMDKKLAWPVKLFAGPEFMREYNKRQVWASAPGPSSALLNLTQEASKKGKPVYGAYAPMGVQSSDSAHHMFDALMAQVPGSGLDPKVATKFDRALKNGEHILGTDDDAKRDRSRARDTMKKWPGLANAKEASEFAKGLTGKHRAAIVKFMDKAPWLEAGLPAVGMTRVAITDPETWGIPGNMIGHRVVRLDPDYVPSEGSGKYPHTTYKAPTGGEYVGDVPPVERQHALPDPMIERAQKPAAGNRLVHPYSGDPSGRSTMRKLTEENKQTQPMTDEWLENIQRGQQGQAGLGLKTGGRIGKADGGQVDDPAAQPPTPGMGHNQPPEAMAPAPSYIKPVDEDKRRLTPLGLYSHAAEAVWKQPMMKASPAQFKATLLNKHGVKPDEFKWSGYDQAFDGRDYVTKKEVRDHFIKNLPKIDEAVKADHENEYGDKYSRHPDDDSWEETKYSDYQLPGAKNYRELVLHMPAVGGSQPRRDYDAANKKHFDLDVQRSAASRAWTDAVGEYGENAPETKAAEQRYRDLEKSLNDAHAELGRLGKTSAGIKYASSHWDEPNVLLHLRVSDRAGEPVNRYVWGNKTSGNVTKEFVNEEDARAHLERLPEKLRPNLELRVKKRPMKILHVEEMQSDWGQDARDRGFVEDREARKQQVFEAERRLNVAHQLGKPDAEKAAAQAELDKLLDAQAEEKGGGVPSAPYIDKTGKWTELGLKRILHEAATGGYDRVVFTPGSEQAKRYDLTNHISDLMVQDVGNNRIDMSYRQHGSHDFSGSQEMHPKELGNHIGKELADKIMTQKPDAGGYRHMSGLDLKVGGEGMKGFYDKIVPTALEKLAKQHDPAAKVQLHGHPFKYRAQDSRYEVVPQTHADGRNGYRLSDTQAAERTYRGPWFGTLGEAAKFKRDHLVEEHTSMGHALDITPKMRNSIRRGQRAYAGGGRVGKAAGGTLDMGTTPYSTSVLSPGGPDAPSGTAQRGREALGLIGSGGGGGDAPAPGSGRDFLGKLANDPSTDGMTRLFAAGMAKSGTFSGQDPSTPAPAVVDPNAKPDYPVIRAAGGRTARADGGPVDDTSAPPTDDYQRQVSPVGLYSHAAEAIWKQPQMKASPQQFKQTLINKHGVKPDEFKWTGYDKAFDGRPFVTKREVRDHFQQNMPQVQETVKAFEDDYDYATEEGYNIGPRYAQWQLPGGDNYREVLLHLPRKPLPQAERDEAIALQDRYTTLTPQEHERLADITRRFDTSHGTYKSSHWDIGNVLAHIRMSDRTEDPPGTRWQVEKAGGTWKPKKILHVEEVQSDWGQEGRDRGFDTDEQKAARAQIQELKKKRSELADYGHSFDNTSAIQDINKQIDTAHQIAYPKGGDKGVNDAPFINTTDKWTDLALKRVLHEAATGNYDKVIFTNGKDQAERYNLSKHIRKIEAKRMTMPPGVKPEYFIDAYGLEGEHVHGHHHDADELPGIVGAEMAKRIIEETDKAAGKTHVYNQLDLQVGGEGMHQYYDKQLPKRLEKLAKMHDPKADVKLYGHKMAKTAGPASGEDVMNEMGVDPDAQDTYWRNLTPEMRDQHFAEHKRRQEAKSYALHSLEMTPKMKASILGGQRAFAAGGRIEERVYQKIRKAVPVAGRYP